MRVGDNQEAGCFACRWLHGGALQCQLSTRVRFGFGIREKSARTNAICEHEGNVMSAIANEDLNGISSERY